MIMLRILFALFLTAGAASAQTIGPAPELAGTTFRFNVQNFGAANNGAGNQATAINNAITAATAAGGGVVWFPDGEYRLDLSVAGSTIAPKSNVTLMGASRNSVKITCDDSEAGSAGPWIVCLGITSGSLHNFAIDGITFNGKVLTSPIGSGTILVDIKPAPTGNQYNCSNIRIENSAFTNGRYFGLVVKACDGVVIRGNRVAKMARDGIDAWNTPNVLITDNVIENSNDDAISVSHAAYPTASPPAEPIPNSCIISNNLIIESQGIVLSDSKGCSVTGNVMKRMLGRPMIVQSTTVADGSSPTSGFAHNITNNVIQDTFVRPGGGSAYNQSGFYLLLGGGPKQVLTNAFGTAGTYGFYYDGATEAEVNNPGGAWINVYGNIFTRTLPAQVTNYSEWGYNPSGLWTCLMNGGASPADITCGYSQLPVTETLLQLRGIIIDSPLRDSRIADNTIAVGKSPIEFTIAGTPAALAFDNLEIANNKLSDCALGNACILWNEATTNYQRITIRGNKIDGDPRFVAAARGANGTWASTDIPYAINFGAVPGLTIVDNEFRNVSTVTATTAAAYVFGNRVYANPAGGAGCSSSNVGVRCIPLSGPDYVVIHEDSNPNSGTFGQMLSNNTLVSTAVPSTGTWVRGAFVQNNTVTIANNVATLGWLRATTGSGNVSGTDWQPLIVAQAASGSGSMAMTTSPTFVTPTIGVAAGTSLALGGCTIGSFSLCGAAGLSAASADGFYLGTVKALFQNGNYTTINDSAAAALLAIGNATDATIYYSNDTHRFRSRNTATIFAQLTSGQLSLPGSSHAIELGAVGSSNAPFMDWHSSSSSTDYDVRMQATGGTGSAGNGVLTFTGLRFTFSGQIVTPGYTVAALPAAVTGARVHVTDQLTTCAVPGAALTGGGALTCPVFYNGAAWVGG